MLFNKIKKYIFVFVMAFSLNAQSQTERVEIEAVSLQGSKLTNSAAQVLGIYTPPSYKTSNARYPVLYYLHGYGGDVSQASSISNALQKAIQNKQAQEMIVVAINGNNQFGGSFYANSPNTGNWEDFVTKDVLIYIDSHYRTKSAPQFRGLAGFSMGGSAVVNIGLAHPDKFKHLFALSPGLFDENGLNDAVAQWQKNYWTQFLEGYASAFAPNENNWNKWENSSAEVRAQWESGFGNLPEKLNAYLKNPNKLISIHIEYGKNDGFAWIPRGSRYLVKLLEDKQMPVTEVDHKGGHVIGLEQGTSMVVFFDKAFQQ